MITSFSINSSFLMVDTSTWPRALMHLGAIWKCKADKLLQTFETFNQCVCVCNGKIVSNIP